MRANEHRRAPAKWQRQNRLALKFRYRQDWRRTCSWQGLLEVRTLSAGHRERGGRAKCHRALRNRKDRSIRVRRRDQLRAKNGGGNEQSSVQSAGQLDDLSPRCLACERWLHPADQPRSAGWQPWRSDHRNQRRRRVHASVVQGYPEISDAVFRRFFHTCAWIQEGRRFRFL